MPSVYIIIACFIAFIIFFVYMRNVYKHKSERLNTFISNIPAYQSPNNHSKTNEHLKKEQNKTFDNLIEILEYSFKEQIITGTEEELFTNHFSDIFDET